MSDVREQDYITEVRAAAAKVWEGINDLKAMQREWNALDYGTTLSNGTGGHNEGILAADIGSVVFATANAISTVLDAGHATNIAKIL